MVRIFRLMLLLLLKALQLQRSFGFLNEFFPFGPVFRLMLVFLYIYSNNIPPIMIVNMVYETQNLLSL